MLKKIVRNSLFATLALAMCTHPMPSQASEVPNKPVVIFAKYSNVPSENGTFELKVDHEVLHIKACREGDAECEHLMLGKEALEKYVQGKNAILRKTGRKALSAVKNGVATVAIATLIPFMGVVVTMNPFTVIFTIPIASTIASVPALRACVQSVRSLYNATKAASSFCLSPESTIRDASNALSTAKPSETLALYAGTDSFDSILKEFKLITP
jgi:hypothetical protein